MKEPVLLLDGEAHASMCSGAGARHTLSSDQLSCLCVLICSFEKFPKCWCFLLHLIRWCRQLPERADGTIKRRIIKPIIAESGRVPVDVFFCLTKLVISISFKAGFPFLPYGRLQTARFNGAFSSL